MLGCMCCAIENSNTAHKNENMPSLTLSLSLSTKKHTPKTSNKYQVHRAGDESNENGIK